MWFFIFLAAIVASLIGICYVSVCISKFGIFSKLNQPGRSERAIRNKRIRYFLSFMLLLVGIIALSLIFTLINAILIFLFLFAFFIIYGIIIYIIKRISKRDDEHIYWQGWLAIVSTVLYFVLGYFLCNHVWQTDYAIKSSKDVNLRIALIADSHLSATLDGDAFAENMKRIEAAKPDVLLISGDFVDDSSKKEDMLKACQALGQMKLKYGVYFAYGNHDEGYFNNRDFSADDLKKALLSNGVHVMEDSYELVEDKFYIVGRLDKTLSKDRLHIDELLEDLDENKYIIVMDHEPNDYKNEAESSADLVISGHTHGGQLMPINYLGQWFGLNDRTYGYENRKDTDFIVTSGISDWELKFKTGTKSEYVIIDVNN